MEIYTGLEQPGNPMLKRKEKPKCMYHTLTGLIYTGLEQVNRFKERVGKGEEISPEKMHFSFF